MFKHLSIVLVFCLSISAKMDKGLALETIGEYEEELIEINYSDAFNFKIEKDFGVSFCEKNIKNLIQFCATVSLNDSCVNFKTSMSSYSKYSKSCDDTWYKEEKASSNQSLNVYFDKIMVVGEIQEYTNNYVLIIYQDGPLFIYAKKSERKSLEIVRNLILEINRIYMYEL